MASLLAACGGNVVISGSGDGNGGTGGSAGECTVIGGTAGGGSVCIDKPGPPEAPCPPASEIGPYLHPGVKWNHDATPCFIYGGCCYDAP